MPSELSDALAFSRTNATRVVDDLEQRGLIARHPCAIDRATDMYLALTEQGLANRRSHARTATTPAPTLGRI